MSDKAVKKQKEKLGNQINNIKHPKTTADLMNKINVYNSMVLGIHSYYGIATDISVSCSEIAYYVSNKMEDQRLNISKHGITKSEGTILKRYGKSNMMRYIESYPIAPVGYVTTKKPACKRITENRYTKEGREQLHKKLGVPMVEIANMMKQKIWKDCTVEYYDNRISLYAMQYGKCAVTGEMITADQIHCHHKIPKRYGGTDAYTNLIIVSKVIHALIHATNEDVINLHKHCIKDKGMLEKLNTLRILANNKPITI